MVSRVRTINFLPDIFRTPTNEQFLSATLDQLTSQPKTMKIQGFIGSKFGYGVNSTDGYVVEPNKIRTDYQLEPGVVFLKKNTSTAHDVLTYPGLIDSLKLEGGVTEQQDDLFNNQFYSWDSFVDLDKLINYNQYFWLPEGPEVVIVGTNDVYNKTDFTVVTSGNYIKFDANNINIKGENPTITLLRGGTYNFYLNQDTKLWIQGMPGTAGTDLVHNNIPVRDVLGVDNNGISKGTIKFTVPSAGSQPEAFYPSTQTVDLLTTKKWDEINGKRLSQIGGIDGISSLQGRTIVFYGNAPEDKGYIGEFYDDSEFGLTWYEQGFYSTLNNNIYYIDYTGDPEDPVIRLTEYKKIVQFDRIKVLYGDVYSYREVYVDDLANMYFVPYLSALMDTLYYQDESNPARVGVIKIIDKVIDNQINIETEILGKKTYTSPQGVVFTNGLKVTFTGNIYPEEYTNNEYYVEGVGTSIALLPVTDFTVVEPFGQTFYNPWDVAPNDTLAYDGSVNIPMTKDYITIHRNSVDKNAWTRSNRWFHIDVLRATAQYRDNLAPIVLQALNNPEYRAKRPVIEFYPNLKLFQQAAVSKGRVEFFENTVTDPFGYNGNTPICAGASTFFPNGSSNPIPNGVKIVFSKATDPDIRNKIYVVNYVKVKSTGSEVITLSEAPNGTTKANEQVYVSMGNNKGKTFYYDGAVWKEGQLKQRVNQTPLYDIMDSNNISLSDQDYYMGSSFSGSTLFQYAIGTGSDDPILGFPIKYSSVINIGDIVFEVSLNEDKFDYVEGVSSPITKNINLGYVWRYDPAKQDYVREIGWQTAVGESFQYQVFDMKYTGGMPVFIADVPFKNPESTPWPVTQVYVDNTRLALGEYTRTINEKGETIITLEKTPEVGTPVQVLIYSDKPSATGYYQIPSNLQYNPFNSPIESINLGDIRGHYKSICNNITSLVGNAFGPNNYRDLGNLVPYGSKVIQSSASLVPAAAFLRNQDFSIFNALKFNGLEYVKYKALLMDTINKTEYSRLTSDSAILEDAMHQIAAAKSESGSFFWTDMVPIGNKYASNSYTFVNFIKQTEFPLTRIYDFSTANYYSVLVYIDRVENGVKYTSQLIRGVDYDISADEPKVIVYFDLLPNDTIRIDEYYQTYGSFVPSTPTKMGLYPASIPEVVYDQTYVYPTYFIKGHDGSLTKLYGTYEDGHLQDYRDRALLEFEKRIYNNLKLSNVIPIEYDDVFPGYSRQTDYTDEQVQRIYSYSFLDWVGKNNIDYKSHYFDVTNVYTYNYRGSLDKLTYNKINKGNWRGVYMWLYDTTTPHITPWEMLGFVNKPTWWEQRYGVAPYTSDNQLLWSDLAAGYNWNNGNPIINKKRARPNLLEILPVDSYGNLVSPLESFVFEYDENIGNAGWAVGDLGPAEYSYLKSSSWPFDLMRIFALTKPAKFFALGLNVDEYEYNSEFNQYLEEARFRNPLKNIPIYGKGTAVHGYVNWVVDYIQQMGMNGNERVSDLLSNLDVRLTYRLAGFSDKSLLRFYVEKGTPSSKNSSLLIPDESYSILLYNNQPYTRINYSSVIVQKTENGYKVYGNSQSTAYFKTLTPKMNGNYNKVTVGTVTVQLSKDYTDNIHYVPYGTEFTTVQALCEFLINYSRQLEQDGMIFDNVENGVTVDWNQMIAEFMYWTQIGWEIGSTVNINPAATTLTINKENGVVQPLTLHQQNFVLNQNLIPIQVKDMNVYRNGTEFKISTLDVDQTFSYLTANISNIEHCIVFDNQTLFNDILYNLNSGLRQQRIFVKGVKSAEWNGYLDAQGFIVNQDNVQEWQANVKYTKGVIVKYRNNYYISTNIIQPKATFDDAEWVKTDYDTIQKGLLPNPSARSYESTLYYDIHNTNLENDGDLLGFSLIGYRPRDYLAVANLDDVTQVNVFMNMIKEMGTFNAANNLKNIKVPQGQLGYDIYENWSIKTGDFGGVLNTNFVEFKLDEAKLKPNPSLVGITSGYSDEPVNQYVDLYNISNYGLLKNTTEILPRVENNVGYKLPDAGYVNFNDVKLHGYNLNCLLSAEVPISNLYKTDYVWLADYKGKWNVFTPVPLGYATGASITLKRIDNNLNNTAKVHFNSPHGLSKNDIIGLVNFDNKVDGYYTVVNIPDIMSVTIELSLPPSTKTFVGSGIVFKMQSVRVDTPKDATETPLLTYEFDNAKVWCDKNTDGSWAVYNKNINYNIEPFLKPFFTQKFGSASTYIKDYGYLFGDAADGTVYVYQYNSFVDQYVSTDIISKTGTFGTAIEKGTNTTVITDSAGGKAYFYRTVETRSGVTEFVLEQTADTIAGAGTSVAVSTDDIWIYVSDYENNKVRVFQRDDDYLYTDTTRVVKNKINAGANSFTVAGNRTSTFTPGIRITFETSVYVAIRPDNYIVVASVYDTATNTTTVGLSTPVRKEIAANAQIYRATVNYSPSGEITVNNSQSGDNFGFKVSTNFDGSSVFVSAPGQDYDGDFVTWEADTEYQKGTVIFNDGVYYECLSTIPAETDFGDINTTLLRAFSGVGYTFAFERLTQTWEQKYNAKDFITQYWRLFWTASSILPTPIAYLNGKKLIEASDYDVLLNTVLIFRTLKAGDILSITGNKFVHKQTLKYYTDNTEVRNNTAAGTGIDCNILGTETIMGVPFLVNDVDGREGAAIRFTDGGRAYGIIHGVNNTNVSSPTTILINGFAVQVSGDANNVATQINNAAINNVHAVALDGKLTIALRDVSLNPVGNKLIVSVLNKTTLAQLGLETYTKTQTLYESYNNSRTQFGSNIRFNDHNSFVINAPVTKRREIVRFDYTNDGIDNDTIFDNNFTQFIDERPNAGAVYMYDYMPNYNESVNEPGQYVFAQACNDYTVNYGYEPNYGESLYFDDYQVIIGTPNFDPGTGNGSVVIYRNEKNEPNWSVHRTSAPVADVNKLQGVHLFNNVTNVTVESLDYLDPLAGRLLGSVHQNLDVISSTDPAGYNNTGASSNIVWGASHVGSIWLDTSRIRFVNYHQDDIVYNSERWGSVFPGSTVAVYSWIESYELPAFYSGTGTPYDLDKYVTTVSVNSAGNLVAKYYYWVRNTGTIFKERNKSLADSIIESYIVDPKNSGISYFAPITTSVYGLYNIRQYLNDTDVSMHITYGVGEKKDTLHSEYKLIRDGYPTDFIPGIPSIANNFADPTGLYDRMLDSLSGIDEKGAVVPDITLPKAMQRGINSRPRQSFFNDRFEALDNYLGYANEILASFPVAETKSPTFLTRVGSINPSTREPFYDTSTVWDYVNWWADGYSDAVKTVFDVPKFYNLEELEPTEGMLVGVEANSVGKREVYLYSSGNWTRVGLEKGTIQFKDKMWDYAKNRIGFGENFFDTDLFDSYPAEETRNVVRAINEEIYTDDLVIHRNKSLVLLFNYIQSENIESGNYLPWLAKTSFIDVAHTIRQLKQYEKFQRDNVDFLYGYLNEVKPYHVVMKEFYLKYDGTDVYDGMITDFDLPAIYDKQSDKFVTPSLTYAQTYGDAEFSYSSSIWQTPEYQSWYDNYGLTITGQDNYKIGILKKEMNLLSDDILVNNAFPFPAQGIIKIDNEYISYTSVDRDYNLLKGVSRGIYNSTVTTHSFNATLYMDIPEVVVYDTGRGYTEPPLIAAYIDTSIYPAPKVVAKFRAIMQLDKVIGVEVVTQGEGYAVTPELRFAPSITTQFNETNIDYLQSTITVPTTELVTGDCVQYTLNNQFGIKGLKEHAYYYIRVIVNLGTESIVALYNSKRDAVIDSDRISMFAGNNSINASLSIVPRAGLVMSPAGVRTITPMLKFDRTSYRPMVTEWVAGNYYGSGLSIVNSSSSLELSDATNYDNLPKMNRNSSSRARFQIQNVFFGGYFSVGLVAAQGTQYSYYDSAVSGFNTLKVQPISIDSTGYSVNGSTDPWNLVWVRATDISGDWAEYKTDAGITLLGVLGSSNSLPSVGSNSDGDAYLAPDAFTGYRRIYIYVVEKDSSGNPTGVEYWSSSVDNSCAVLITQAAGGAVTAVTAWGTPGTAGKGSLQGALFPIVDVKSVGGQAVAKIDMNASGLNIAQLKNLNLYFYSKLPPYRYDDTANGGAIIDIYKPRFTPVKVINEYTAVVVNPGAIYQPGDKITIRGSQLNSWWNDGSVNVLNDVTITIVSVSGFNAIDEIFTSGVAVTNFKSYYVNPVSSDEIQIFNDINLSIPTPLANFPYITGDNGFVNDPALAVAGPRFNYVNYVVYENDVYKCTESNNDKTFLYDKWERVETDFSLFNALDRIVGYYQPTLDMPGKNLSLLVNDITYPNNTYLGNAFSPDDEFPVDIELQSKSFYPSDIDLKSIIFDGYQYIGVGDTSQSTAIIKSTDGVNWNITNLSEQPLDARDITYDGSTYVIATPNKTTPAIVSFDSINWFSSGEFTPYDELGFDATSFDSSALNLGQVKLYGDAYGANKFVLVGEQYVFTSDNGLAWDKAFDYGTTSQVLSTVTYADITYFKGFVAVGSGYQIIGSTTTPSSTTFVNSGIVLTSTDGVTWNKILPAFSNVGLFGVAADDEHVVAVGQNGNIYISTNASNWTKVASPVSTDLYDITFNNGIFVAVGKDGVILKSSDGFVWTVANSSVTVNLRGVNFDGTRFIAVGDNSTILFSDNGLVWESVGNLTNTDPFNNIEGAPFLTGYGPEEMVPGVVSDNLSMYVKTRPSGPWNYDTYGHSGFGMASRVAVPGNDLKVSFDGLVDIPSTIAVYIVDRETLLGYRIYENTVSSNLSHTYTVDWINKTITLSSSIALTKSVLVEVYEVGGGNQIAKDSTDNIPLRLNSLTGNSEIYLGYNYDSTIYSTPVCYLNGVKLEFLKDYSLGTTTERTTKIIFNAAYTQNVDYITFAIFGSTITSTSPDQYGYSLPQVEIFEANGTDKVFALENFVGSAQQTTLNNIAAIVEVNGLRKITPDDITFNVIPNLTSEVVSSTTGSFTLNSSDYPDTVKAKVGSKIKFAVGLNPIEYVITSSSVDPSNSGQWIIEAEDSSSNPAPEVDSGTLVHISACVEFGTAPTAMDIIGITTFNDIRQQSLVLNSDDGYVVNRLYYVDNSRTPVRVYLTNPVTLGPWTDGTAVRIDGIVGSEQLNNNYYYTKYLNDTAYELYQDSGLTSPVQSNLITNYESGGYIWKDSQQITVSQTLFDMTNAARTYVTVNGERLSSSRLRYVNNNVINILAPIEATDLVCITSMVPDATPNELVYNLVVDKANVPSVYRSNNNTSTWLTQDLLLVGDEIHINDASRVVDTVEQTVPVQLRNGKLYSVVQVDFEDVREISIYNKNTLSIVSPSAYEFKIFETSPTVLFNDEVSEFDNVVITMRLGDIVVINGERIRFNKIDYANNILSELTRGIQGTAPRKLHQTYSQIYSLIPSNKLDTFYYYQLWDDLIYQTFSAIVTATTPGEFKFNLLANPGLANVRTGDSVTFTGDPTVYKVKASVADPGNPTSVWVIRVEGLPSVTVGQSATFTYVYSGNPLQLSNTPASKFLRLGAV